MTSTQPTDTEPDEPTSTRDLRAKLLEDLSSMFAAELEADGTLPAAARESLIALVTAETPTSDAVLEALSKTDPTEEEVADG